MSSVQVAIANVSPRKRTFDQSALFATTTISSQRTYQHHVVNLNIEFVEPAIPPTTLSRSKRFRSFSRSNTMLVESPSIMSGSFPSFMSVFGNSESSIYRDINLDDQSKIEQHAFPHDLVHKESNPQTTHPTANQLLHRNSVTSFSDSTESSPTTTSSTFDSPLMADPSPSSSPESASSVGALRTFENVLHISDNKTSNGFVTDKPASLSFGPVNNSTSREPRRNMKKLALDMTLPALIRPATISGIESTHPLSAPASPLKEPLKTGRRKPNNLTIKTPGFNQLTFENKLNGNVPSTPSQRPTLHQYQTSPSLASLTSPSIGPPGGMYLRLPNMGQHSKHNSTSSFDSSLVASLPEVREEDSIPIPKSQEAPERGYTNGPIQIYDSGVFLYLEPTAEEAGMFDTVINVAKEIKNPFTNRNEESGTVMSVWRTNDERANIPEPQTAVSEISFKSAFEWPQVNNTNSPTTPRQSSHGQLREPEYIHVKWDHNSEILPDLLPLCHIIDERVTAGKKVLIHCQLGVSRSASLIIAYGLYKGDQPDFHSMYMAVKARSRWVGPNMSLIYQLTDFRNRVVNHEHFGHNQQANPAWFHQSTGNLKAHTATSPANPITTPTIGNASVNPRSVPVKRVIAPLKLNKALPPTPAFSTSESTTTTATRPTALQAMSIKPVSHANSTPTISQQTPTVKRAASRPLPFRARNHISSQMVIPPHRPKVESELPLAQPSSVMDLAMRDVPESPLLFSPRRAEFVAPPFGIKGAGDLVVPESLAPLKVAPTGFSWLPKQKAPHMRTPSVDPRSPHQHSESKEFIESIDRFL